MQMRRIFGANIARCTPSGSLATAFSNGCLSARRSAIRGPPRVVVRMKSLDVSVPGNARSAQHHHTAIQASVAIGPLYYDKTGSMPYAVRAGRCNHSNFSATLRVCARCASLETEPPRKTVEVGPVQTKLARDS